MRPVKWRLTVTTKMGNTFHVEDKPVEELAELGKQYRLLGMTVELRERLLTWEERTGTIEDTESGVSDL